LRSLSPVFVLLVVQQPQPPLRVTARLVEVQVIAEAKSGEAVPGLAWEDFALFDEGQEQKISLFAAETSQAAEAAEPLPPNTFSNRLERTAEGARSATAILFDGLNTRITDRSYAREQILKFLDQLQARDKIALFALGRGLNVLQDFTSDAQALKNALAGYKGDLSMEAESALGPGVDTGVVQLSTWLNEVRLNLIDYYRQDRALRTIRALVAIANHMERLPGRKNLIWVSGSFPVWIGRESAPLPEKPAPGIQTFWPEIERAARALNNANLAVYPVDARGLIATEEYSPEKGSISREAATSSVAGYQVMQVLAERTGGRAFYNNNDLRLALRRATDDGRLVYVLGYKPAHNEWDGKFRRIKVKVKRPGVRVRHREGYFAQPEEPGEPWYRDGVLSAAVWSPVDATRLGLTVRVTPQAGARLDLELELDPRDVRLEQKEGIWQGAVDICLVQIGPRDRHLQTLTHIANLTLSPQTHERVFREKSLVLVERLDRLREAVLLRILVRDIASGALGSVSIPVSRIVERPRSGGYRPPSRNSLNSRWKARADSTAAVLEASSP